MYLKDSKTIVIKIGSSLLINDKKKIRKKWLSGFAKDIKELLSNKKDYIISYVPHTAYYASLGYSESCDMPLKKILSVNSQFDIGQSIILQNGTVIGIEASQGTDNLIKNSSNFIRVKKEAVLVKLLKVKQDLRADLPAIGLQTLKNCKKSGLSGIAYSANRTIFINKDDVIDFCRKNRMFLYGI